MIGGAVNTIAQATQTQEQRLGHNLQDWCTDLERRVKEMLDNNITQNTRQVMNHLGAHIPNMHELKELVERLVNEKMTKAYEGMYINLHEQITRLGQHQQQQQQQVQEEMNRQLQDHMKQVEGLMTKITAGASQPRQETPQINMAGIQRW